MLGKIAKHKGKIIAAALIVAALAVTWVWGGGYAHPDAPADIVVAADVGQKAPETAVPETPSLSPTAPEATATATPKETKEPEKEEPKNTETPAPDNPTSTPEPQTTKIPTQESSSKPDEEDVKPDPKPEDKPVPTEPPEVTTGEMTCTLSVRCDTVLNHMGSLKSEKVELVPPDGVLFKTTSVTFYEGESVFNVLQREMKRAKIHMAFRNTPIYDSAYIEGIHNLYEFDCGELSGWMYKVNGLFPDYGCSRYQLKAGDVIEWLYTCDLGRDIGGGYAAGGAKE